MFSISGFSAGPQHAIAIFCAGHACSNYFAAIKVFKISFLLSWCSVMTFRFSLVIFSHCWPLLLYVVLILSGLLVIFQPGWPIIVICCTDITWFTYFPALQSLNIKLVILCTDITWFTSSNVIFFTDIA